MKTRIGLRLLMLMVGVLLQGAVPRGSIGIVIDNGIPRGTLGYWSVDVTSGGETTVGELTATDQTNSQLITADVIWAYRTYVDPGTPGGGFRLNGGTPQRIDPHTVSSQGQFTGANGNTIDWTVLSVLPAGSATMTNTFQFVASNGPLGALRLLQYLDEDVVGSSDDVFFTRGSLGNQNLELFTIDNSKAFGISHSGAFTGAGGLEASSFAGWAADRWDSIVPRIQGGGQSVALAGVINNLPPYTHPLVGPVYGPQDIVSVMAWDVDPNATRATIVTSLGGVPVIRQCGDGSVDGIEECDDGNLNGGDGCSANCEIESCFTCTGQPSECHIMEAGTGCADDGFPCTRDVCDANGNCVHPYVARGVVCRTSVGDCDAAESCTGTGAECPPDSTLEAGTGCADDGFPCTRDVCDANGNCVHPYVARGVVCRTSVGGCDVAESCTGTSPECPPDSYEESGHQCVCGDGTLDPGEECDDGNNLSGDCCSPSCRLDPAGAPCDDGLVCTSGETCDGFGVCRGAISAGQYAILDWVPADNATTILGQRAITRGHICAGKVVARGGSKVKISGSVLGDLISRIGSGSNAITFGKRVHVAGSAITAGGAVVHPEYASVGGSIVSDASGMRSELLACTSARDVVSSRFSELASLTAPQSGYSFMGLNRLRIKARDLVRIPQVGTLPADNVIIDLPELTVQGRGHLVLVGSPQTRNVIVRIRKSNLVAGNGNLKLGNTASVSLEGLTAKQVIFVVVDGKVAIGPNSRLYGTLMGNRAGMKLSRRATVEGAILGPHPALAGNSRVERHPWAGWCE